MRLAVTTSGQPDATLAARASSAAKRWGIPFVPRARKQPLGPMLGREADAFLVFSKQLVELVDAHGAMKWSAGMGHLRVKRLDAGEADDVMVKLAPLCEADAVLDCTLGLGADALVAARAVGPRGRVVGLEKSLALFALAEEGFAAHDAGPRSCRVEVVHADALAYLSSLSPKSFDVVLFDPMFDKPRRASGSFEMLRRYADATPLSPEALVRARTAARRCVLVKLARHSKELARLGLKPARTSPYARVDWVRLDAA